MIDKTIKMLKLRPNDFYKLDIECSKTLINLVEERFTNKSSRYLWHNFVGVKSTTSSKDDLSHLTKKLIPESTEYFFIPDINGINNVYVSANLSLIKKVLQENVFFEYYILPKDISWIYCENDHSESIFVKRNNT